MGNLADGGNRRVSDICKILVIGIECHRIRFPRGRNSNAFAPEQGGEALLHSVQSAEWLWVQSKWRLCRAPISPHHLLLGEHGGGASLHGVLAPPPIIVVPPPMNGSKTRNSTLQCRGQEV